MKVNVTGRGVGEGRMNDSFQSLPTLRDDQLSQGIASDQVKLSKCVLCACVMDTREW